MAPTCELILAEGLGGSTLLVVGVVGIMVLAVVYFAIRFWLVSTRPADIREVKTPSLDRMNRTALEHMGEQSVEQDEEEAEAVGRQEAPEGLKSVAPIDEQKE